MQPATCTILRTRRPCPATPLIPFEWVLTLPCVWPASQKWISSLPSFVGRATRFYKYVHNLPHSRRSCAFQPERLYSRFPPLALPKYGTLACPIYFFFLPFCTMVYICSQFRSSTRQFCDPTLFPYLQFYPATSRQLYWRFLVSNLFLIWNRLIIKHVVRPHVRVSKARASAPPLPLSFFCPHVKRAPQLVVFLNTRYRLHNENLPCQAARTHAAVRNFNPNVFSLLAH